MKKLFLILWFALFVFAVPFSQHSASAKVYVDIDSPAFKLIPIAVSDFNDQSAGAMKKADAGTNVPEGVKNDLTLTGIFNVLNKKSFLDYSTAVTAENIHFPDWRVIGADYLLRGSVLQNDKEMVAVGYLFDVVRGELIFSRKYRADPDNFKAVSRELASDIMMALINEKGDFHSIIAFVSHNRLQSDIASIDYDGSDLRSLTNHRSILLAPRWSADGTLLAFTSFKRGRPEVYIRNLRTGTEQRVASFDGLNLCGGFSPDGKKLLLTLSKDGNEEIYSLDVGTLTLRRLTSNYAIDVSPSWSPDGKKIVFVSNRSGSPQVYTMNADGSGAKRITYDGSYNTSPAWSPRGDRIVYEGLINRVYQIFSIDEDGSNPVQLTFDQANNESPSWSPSGRQIVYVSRRHSKSAIIIMNSNGSNPRKLYEQSHKLSMPVWSPRLK
jgi:TolB protein